MWVVAWLCQGSTCHDTMGQVAGETMRRFTLQPKHDGQRKCVCFCLCLPTLPLEESSPVVTWKSCFFLITLTCLLWEVVLVSGSCLALWVGQSALMSFPWHVHNSVWMISWLPGDYPVTVLPLHLIWPAYCLYPQTDSSPVALVLPYQPPNSAHQNHLTEESKHVSPQDIAMFPFHQQVYILFPNAMGSRQVRSQLP